MGFTSPSITAQPGTKIPVTVQINRVDGFAGKVTVTPPASGNGISSKTGAVKTAGDSASFKLKIGSSVAPGSYQLAFTGEDKAGQAKSASVTVVVQ